MYHLRKVLIFLEEHLKITTVTEKGYVFYEISSVQPRKVGL